MALLRLRDITFSYGGASLLDGVSLEIQPGERIGLMGRNGAGKSTLLRLLRGTLQPDDGVIERRGRNANLATGPRSPRRFEPHGPRRSGPRIGRAGHCRGSDDGIRLSIPGRDTVIPRFGTARRT